MNQLFKHCIIVDDEHLALLLIENYLNRYGAFETIRKFRDPFQALDACRQQGPDLLLLDINMPGMDGIELLGRLEPKPATIFTTAYADHAHKAFDLDAADFLVKPFSCERFCRAIQKAQNAARQPLRVPGECLVFRTNRTWVKVLPTDIYFIEAWKEYVRIHCATEILTVYMSMQQMEEKLPPDFVRIHRSYIVAKSKLQSFNTEQVRLVNGRILPVAKSRKDQALIQLRSEL